MVHEFESDQSQVSCFKELWNQILLLRDSQLVANFQQYFGIHWKTNNKCESNGNVGISHESYDKFNGDKADVIASTHHQDKNGFSKFNGSKDLLRKRRNSQQEKNETQSSHANDFVSESSDSSEESDGNVSMPDYQIDNKFWYYLFSFGASLGYETFYATFFPFWFWNIDSAVGRRMVLVWVIIMYVGQVLKDVIRWPRPTSPPVVSLEPEYAVEFGMPSTHAMVGSALPTTILIFTMHRYEYPIWIGLVIALFWCSLVCASRLYMGMHTVLDIIAGLLLTAVLMVILIPLVDAIDEFHLTSSYTPLITIPLVVFLALFYPKPERWSPARGDTCVIMGAASGILLGSWLNYQLGIYKGPSLDPPFPIMWPGYEVIGLSLLRACIGILCMSAVRAVGKVVIYGVLCHLTNLDPKDPKTKINTNVEIPCKVINYISLGLTITYLSPAVFRFLNIERITMFTEI